MSIYNGVEGEPLTVSALFLDEDSLPLVLHNTWAGPIVRLKDSQDDILFEGYAVPSSSSVGMWTISVDIPTMDLHDVAQFSIEWEMLTNVAGKYSVTDVALIQPSRDRRVGDIVVLEGTTSSITLTLPVLCETTISNPDLVSFSLFENNTAIYSDLPSTDSTVTQSDILTKSTFTLPAVVGDATMAAKLLTASYYNQRYNKRELFTFKVWVVTPQMLVASSLVEDFINKARLDNVIPALEYTQGDLMAYLYRGLQLFNSYPTIITNFNGRNMQGALLDTWVTCSCYYALGAQLQAEGALAFDFSGQVVNLNVDRSPAIEAALGRIESRLEDQVKPYKKLLAKTGLTSGDGAQGNNVANTPNIGTLGLINAPTTMYSGGRTSRFRSRIQ